MNEVARAGRTILFVSHDLGAVNSLCERAILLHEGAIVRDGPTREVTDYYLDTTRELYSPITWADLPQGESDEIQLRSVSVRQRGVNTSTIDCREQFTISLEYENRKTLPGSRFFILVRNGKGEVVFATSDYDVPTPQAIDRQTGTFISEVTIPGELLKAGSYYATVGADIKNQRIIIAENDCLQFEVYESEDDALAERHKRPGLVAPVLRWEISEARPEK